MKYEMEMILKLINSRFVCVNNGNRHSFESKSEFLNSLFATDYIVTSIAAEDSLIVLNIEKYIIPTTDVGLLEKTDRDGSEISFF